MMEQNEFCGQSLQKLFKTMKNQFSNKYILNLTIPPSQSSQDRMVHKLSMRKHQNNQEMRELEKRMCILSLSIPLPFESRYSLVILTNITFFCQNPRLSPSLVVPLSPSLFSTKIPGTICGLDPGGKVTDLPQISKAKNQSHVLMLDPLCNPYT